jgi:hypothetical protein
MSETSVINNILYQQGIVIAELLFFVDQYLIASINNWAILFIMNLLLIRVGGTHGVDLNIKITLGRATAYKCSLTQLY